MELLDTHVTPAGGEDEYEFGVISLKAFVIKIHIPRAEKDHRLQLNVTCRTDSGYKNVAVFAKDGIIDSRYEKYIGSICDARLGFIDTKTTISLYENNQESALSNSIGGAFATDAFSSLNVYSFPFERSIPEGTKIELYGVKA